MTFARQSISPGLKDIKTEYCFYIEAKETLSAEEEELLRWLLSETFEPENFSSVSFLTDHDSQLTSSHVL